MGLPQSEDRSPVLEDTVFDTDLRRRIDIEIALVLFLPGSGSRETGVSRSIPLHRRASVVSGFQGDFLLGDAVQLGIVGVLFHHPKSKQ